MKNIVSLFCLSLLVGCANIQMPQALRGGAPNAAPSEPAATDGPLSAITIPDAGDTAPPAPAPEVVEQIVEAPPPPPAANTAEQFDTTTDAQRVAASGTGAAGGERSLGQTVASLGDPAQAGLWVKTPLVKSATTGRVVNPANGKSALVELLPLEGVTGTGSQISLAAMRLIDVPLTELPTLEIFVAGA